MLDDARIISVFAMWEVDAADDDPPGLLATYEEVQRLASFRLGDPDAGGDDYNLSFKKEDFEKLVRRGLWTF
jgi:hypothetical protein